MDFMVPAGIRLDMADGSMCLQDEVRIQLSGRHQLFSGNSRLITFDQHHKIPVAGSVEIAIRRSASDRQKVWVTRGEQWVPTAVKGLGSTQYLRITNVSERSATLQRGTRVYLAGRNHVPQMPGFGSIGSRRYAEWQNLALQDTTEQQAVNEVVGTATEPIVDRPQYEPPTKILSGRQERRKAMVVLSASAKGSNTAQYIAGEGQGFNRRRRVVSIRLNQRERPRAIENSRTQVEPKEEADDDTDDGVCYHEGGEIFPEDIENVAVLPEVEATTKEVTIDDIQVDEPHATPEERAGNALLPAALGAICDIDVGTAKHRCRRVVAQFREKLPMLIKGLLLAKIITTSISPWASPIVVIIKANGVDIRLYIDYQPYEADGILHAVDQRPP
ncbi:LOW QUALITY PROTEIN: hypothetical protein PHMEG_00034832 [Phytophthora megakarya]|uniref:Reverse transcriptase n=1 Tax=Phytophthora megakarya TaxID=4795 RepID=A0A225UQ56_9STRA|nr:LOW QUALITY PROTEIN: hypothetical protein PHMEG_00034832 [Phytophthora megakarya]